MKVLWKLRVSRGRASDALVFKIDFAQGISSYMWRHWFVLAVFCVAECSGFFKGTGLGMMINVGAATSRKTYLFNRLEHMRGRLKTLKLEIMNTIIEQRKHKNTSKEFLDLESRFSELLHAEDALMLDMERVVKQITNKKTFSKSTCTLDRKI